MRPIFDEVQIGSNQVDPIRYPRPVISSLDTWDQNTQIDYHSNPGMPGRRAGWNIPSIAVTSETVNTVRTSAATRFVSQAVPTRAAMLLDKFTTSQSYTTVPNMAQAIRVDSNVQITFSATVRPTPNSAPFFAIFRDGVKISQDYRASGASLTGDTLVSGTYIDTNAPMGHHAYELRWHVDPLVPGATIIASGKNRTFQASNLRAQ